MQGILPFLKEPTYNTEENHSLPPGSLAQSRPELQDHVRVEMQTIQKTEKNCEL